MDHDAHNYVRRLEGQLRLLREDPSISEKNKELICKFKEFSISSGVPAGRIVRYMFDLLTLAQYLQRDFDKAKKEDIQELVGKLEKTDRFSKSTVRDMKLTLRKFYKWLRNTDEFPEEVRWYKTHIKCNSVMNPEDILTEEEVKRMIECCLKPRDRAFISFLYESGCRIGEVLLLRINQVKFDGYGAQALVNGKTGFRRVRLISCAPYLMEWLNKHPEKHDGNAYLWVNSRMERLGGNGKLKSQGSGKQKCKK